MPMNSCVIQAHPSGPPKASGPFTSSSLHPTAWNTCGPILSKKDLCLLSSHAPHCPRLVPEGPCGTLSCNPCPLQVPTWLSLLLRPLPQQGTGKLCVGPWPAGHSLPDLNSLPWPKQRDCGAKPEPSEEGRPTPHPTPPSLLLRTLPRLPPARPASSPPPSHRQAALSRPTASIFCSSQSSAGLAALCPCPLAGQGLGRPTGVSVAVGRQDGSREGGKER